MRQESDENPAFPWEPPGGDPTKWSEDDSNTYVQIQAMAVNMLFVYGFAMSFSHWGSRIDYIGLWISMIVACITVFFRSEENALNALSTLAVVSVVSALIGRVWRRHWRRWRK